MLRVFYRISDKGNSKEKLFSADKFSCLTNAIDEFGREEFHVIADNCNQETINFLNGIDIAFEETSLGNCGSFLYMLSKIIASYSGNIPVYLLEDDYLHLPGSKFLLQEGLEFADYVTLYDHPDKYYKFDTFGSHYNYKKLHSTVLYASSNSHWRETDSTTMTFDCRVKTLQEDFSVWEKYMHGRIPDDFHGFMQLTQNKLSDAILFLRQKRRKEFLLIFKNWLLHRPVRKLISAVPAKATHAELKWLAPVVDWRE